MNTVQKFEQNYKLFIDSEDPLTFFRGLGQYIQYIYSIPKLKKAFNNRIEERNRQYRKIEKIQTKVEQEIKNAQEKIVKVIKVKKLDTTKFQRYVTFPAVKTELFTDFDDYLNNRFTVSGYRSDTIQNFLFDIAVNIQKMGYEDEIKEFSVSDKDYSSYYGKINNNGTIVSNQYGNYIFSPTWPERFIEIHLLETERLLKPWGSFEKLFNFQKAYNAVLNNVNLWSDLNHGKIKTKFRLELDVHNLHDTCEMIEDFKVLLSKNSLSFNHSNNWSIRKLHIEPFQTAVKTVHSYLLREMEENNENKKDNDIDTTEEIKLKTHRIKIKDNSISKGDIKPRKVFNPTDKALIYFLYNEFLKNRERCFSSKLLSEKLKRKEGYIDNRVTKINKIIGKIASEVVSVKIIFIKYEKKYSGYHLDYKFLE